jgi:nucleotide-binding universal stress UspA family protein
MAYESLLVHLRLGSANEGLLRITAELAERFHAHVIGVAVCKPLPEIYPAMQTAYGNGIACEDITETDRKVTNNRIAEMEERFRAALAGHATGVEWRSTITRNSRSEYVARQARAADLVITSPVFDGRTADQSQKLSIGDIVLRAGRPVLLIPPETQQLCLDTALVGWKDTREARRALSDALPLLKFAKTTTVVEITAAQDIPDAKRHINDVIAWLKRHGIAAQSRIDSYKNADTVQLAAIAEEVGAGFCVAGAFGHTRVREWVIGGVTMDLLLHPRRPTLVSH